MPVSVVEDTRLDLVLSEEENLHWEELLSDDMSASFRYCVFSCGGSCAGCTTC
ncbi:hypothetical protein ACFW1A_34235 [Kitasatospora sp. NPDC058965]|uniref:hypothetical protein n=1 Tax=Kitasatospora sp. NPDC058965 TaxID=3346682 RepID=UPI003681EB47